MLQQRKLFKITILTLLIINNFAFIKSRNLDDVPITMATKKSSPSNSKHTLRSFHVYIIKKQNHVDRERLENILKTNLKMKLENDREQKRIKLNNVIKNYKNFAFLNEFFLPRYL